MGSGHGHEAAMPAPATAAGRHSGGLKWAAGLSGIVSPLATVVTVALAVSPVPLAVMFLGLQI